MAKSTKYPQRPTPDLFGCSCPYCGEWTGGIIVGNKVWNVCLVHEVAWPGGIASTPQPEREFGALQILERFSLISQADAHPGPTSLERRLPAWLQRECTTDLIAAELLGQMEWEKAT